MQKCLNRPKDGGIFYAYDAEWIRAGCKNCNFQGPRAPTFNLAKDLLCLNHDILNKEQIMNTSDYRRGVEDATKPLISWTDVSERINEIFKQRRKDLLTQKVTKWVIVLKGTDRTEEQINQGRLFDHKEAAERYIKYSLSSDSVLGIYPIEIEIPS